MVEGFDRHYRALPRDERDGEGALRGGGLGGRAAGREGADPLLRRARARVRRAAHGGVRRRARSTTTPGGSAKLLYIGLLVDHKRPELAETFFNSVVTRVLRPHLRPQRLRVRAGRDLDRVHRVRPADLPQLLPGRGRRCGRRFARHLRATSAGAVPFADLDRDVEYVVRALARALRRRVAAARAELPGAGARLGLLPQQGRLRRREDRQRQRRDALRRPRAPRRRRAGSCSTRRSSTRRASPSSSRSRAPTSWSTWTCRRATSSSCSR